MTDRTITPPVWGNIPGLMRDKPQWLVWRFEADPKHPDKKPRKVPYYVGGTKRVGEQGSEKDRQRLAPFEEAKRAFSTGRWDGVGFAFLPGDGLIGVDIDAAIDDDGVIDERAQAIIAACASWTEYSPSRRGVHIYLAGTTERHKCNAAEGQIGLEIFAGAQFFTVTGNTFPGAPAAIAPAEVKLLHRLHRTVDQLRDARAPETPVQAPVAAAPIDAPEDRLADMRAALEAVPAADLHYDEWLAVGGILRAEFGDGMGFPIWDQWSAADPDRYPGTAELAKKWRSFKGMRGGNLIFTLAKARGWKPPRRKPKLRAIEGGKGKPNEKRAEKTAAPGRSAETKKAPYPKKESPDGGGEGPPEPPRVYMPFVSDKGAPKGIRENVYFALLNDPALKGLVVFDEFAELHMKTRPAPWEGKGDKPYEIPIEWHTIDSLQLAHYMAAKHHVILGNPVTVDQAVDMAARDCKVNPVRDYMERVVWDGVERLPYWLHDYIGTAQRDYAALAGTRFFIQLVARVMEPGCKADYALILQGGQGRKKSSLLRVIGGRWFAETPFKIGDKDAYMVLQGILLYEMSELDALSRAESNAAKAFISSRTDRYRAPYGQRVTSVPRRTVLAGTTNPEQFLKDTTGERRYWPFHVEQEIDLEKLAANRDQLFAEAVHRYKAGERWWNDSEEEERIFDPEREPFSQVDPWVDKLSGYVNSERIKLEVDEDGDAIDFNEQRHNCDREFFSTLELLTKGIGVEASRIDRGKQMQGAVASCMRVLGFIPHRETGGKRRRGYLRKPAAAPVAGPQTGSPRPDSDPGPAPDSQLTPAERARQAVEAAHVPL